jgi:Domain of unknown function (DUF222)
VLAGRICAAASLSAQGECQLLESIGEFDAVKAIRWRHDVKSLAHWLSWACSMSPGTAREHVRVACGLRQMPTITTAFREGRLSYSRVRDATRVVGLIDEHKLCQLALTATASQLARMVSGFRTDRRHGRARGTPHRSTGTPTPSWISRAGSSTPRPRIAPGEDRNLVVVHVAADQLIDSQAGVDGVENVPAGTRLTGDPTCHVQGLGGIEPETARLLSCDADVIGAVVNADGKVLTSGRTLPDLTTERGLGGGVGQAAPGMSSRPVTAAMNSVRLRSLRTVSEV